MKFRTSQTYSLYVKTNHPLVQMKKIDTVNKSMKQVQSLSRLCVVKSENVKQNTYKKYTRQSKFLL